MRISANLSMGDLSTPHYTGMTIGEGRHQVVLNEEETVFTHVTADEAQRIADAWGRLAVTLRMINEAIA